MSGNQPVGFVLAPTGPLRWIIARLRIATAQKNFITDTDLLAIINDGYIELVEASRYERHLVEFPLTAGQREYGLPANTCEILRIYMNGVQLEPVALDVANSDVEGDFYYTYSDSFGLQTTPDGSVGSVWIYYASRPIPLRIDDTPLIPPEFYCYLRHYAAWRVLTLQGGAQRIAQANLQRAFFDAAIHMLRSDEAIETTPRRIPVAGGRIQTNASR